MFDSFIQAFTAFDSWLNGVVWGWPMIILILGTGILLTIRTRAVQIRRFGESIRSTIVPTVKSIGKKSEQTKDKNEKSVSQFEAFSAAISGTVGTGNIIGVTSALLTGGPGAVFWMWISAFFGMCTNYAENVLGLFYRQKNKNGDFSGGPFHYIKNGLHWTWLGYIASVVCLFAALGMSGVQTNKISGTMTACFNVSTTVFKIIVGVIVALFAGLIIIGGIKRIGKVASMLVPFMSLIFIVMALVAIIMNITAVPAAFKLIFTNIFGFKAMTGGFGGYAFSLVIKKGMARGVFSNEAGLGSSVIAHSASETKEPVIQGLWGIFEVFFDTFVICTLTALLLITTFVGNGSFDSLAASLSDSGTALLAFNTNFGMFGTVIFAVIIPLFAFTTILAWSYYGEKAAEFCFQWLGEKGQKVAVLCFKIAYLLMIVAAAVIESDLIWSIDDTCNGLMALPNLVALILLSGTVVKITKNYFDRKKGLDVEPMLNADPKLNEEFTKEIKK